MNAPVEMRLFDYSEAEWAEIEISVQAVRRTSLTTKEREALRAAARHYLSPRRAFRRALRAEWKKIGISFEKLRPKLSTCIEQTACVDDSNPKVTELRLMFASMALQHLDGLIRIASVLSDNPGRGDNPRLTYQSKVLEQWVRLGGKLKLSRHSRTQKVQGPLARYFFSVVRPVMGASAPSPESLRDIIERYKTSSSQPHRSAKGGLIRRMYERICENQHQKLMEDLEIMRLRLGPDNPTVIAVERAFGIRNGEGMKG